MTDIEMLPLPEPMPRVLVHVLHEGDMELEAVGNYYAAEQVRACVAHATAAKDAEIEALRAEVAAVWNAMPSGTRYLDPPDGGDVPLHEQVRRMAADAVRAERLAEALREALDCLEGCEAGHAERTLRAALRDNDKEVGNG